MNCKDCTLLVESKPCMYAGHDRNPLMTVGVCAGVMREMFGEKYADKVKHHATDVKTYVMPLIQCMEEANE